MNNAIEQYPGQIKELEERVTLMEEIFRGERIVVPTSIEHAAAMYEVARQYLETHKDSNNDKV